MASNSSFKHLEQSSSADVRLLLTADDGENSLLTEVFQQMLGQLSAARDEFYRRPVASFPFGAGSADRAIVAKHHPEIRELIFENVGERADAQFAATKHLAVRRLLVSVLQPISDTVENPYAHQVLLSGVVPAEHNFMFRTGVTLVDIDHEEPVPDLNAFGVIDLCESRYTFLEILAHQRQTNSSEFFVVAPYDPLMWNLKGGQQLEGGYTYEWVSTNVPQRKELVKSVELPKSFFASPEYKSWDLRIAPYGSSRGYSFTRDEFTALFSGARVVDMFHEVRTRRNGFAEVSYIRKAGETFVHPSAQVVRNEMRYKIPPGHVEVPQLNADKLKEMVTPGRHYDLSSAMPLYVRATFLEKAKQQFFRVSATREIVTAMMRSMHANSARAVYNGAIVKADTMVDPEALCVALERVCLDHSKAKSRVSAVASHARIDSSASPKDYALSLFSWAAYSAVSSSDVRQGANSLISLIRSGDVQPDQSLMTTELPALTYSHAPPVIAEEKRLDAEAIADFAEDTFINPPMPYEISREALPVPDKDDLLEIALALKRYAALKIELAEVQSIYDDLIPGNSLTDPTMAQVAAGSTGGKFIIDCQYFSASVPHMFSVNEGHVGILSQLRTEIGADLIGSFMNMMRSLMKRNFNRTRPEAAGSRKAYVVQAFERVLRKLARPEHVQLLALYQIMPLTVSVEAINLWAARHPIEHVLAAAMLLDDLPPDPSKFRMMPKDIPKPKLSAESQMEIFAGQTVVFHSKDIIALTVGAFTMVVSRLMALFSNDFILAFGADEHSAGRWADKFLDAGYHVTELDVPKFDKSQDWACFELILAVMSQMGCHDDLIKFWHKATEQATVFNAAFHMTFATMFGNRSGHGATLAVNCIVLLIAYCDSFLDAGIVGMAIKGDDSVLVTRRPLEQRHADYLEQRWGFTVKHVGTAGVVSFCSSFFLKDSTGHYQLVRDVVRVITKFGRSLPVGRPAHYFLDYYASVVDTARTYDDPVVVRNLTAALELIYKKPVDAYTLCAFVQYMASSAEAFLGVLYGLPASRVADLKDVDEAFEVIMRSRNGRFVKSREYSDTLGRVKRPLVEKAMMCTDWIYDCAAEILSRD